MSKQKIAVSIPTSALRDLLNDKPEVVAELHSMACEKIAEEVMRKARLMDASQIEARARQVIEGVFYKFSKQYSFPDAAKKLIEGLTSENVKALIDTEKGALRREFADTLNVKTAEAVKKLQEAMREAHVAHREALREDIRKIAREEFFTVLKEARQLG